VVIAGYIAMSLVGMTLGLIGAGGSILTVPILVYFFGHSAADATAYSMGIVGASSLVALCTYWSQGKINFQSAFRFIPASLVGVFVARKLIVPSIPEVVWTSGAVTVSKNQLILSSFAVIMVLAARSMMRSSPQPGVDQHEVRPKASLVARSITTALGVGLVTGFVGAGGGFLIIPALVNLLGMQMAEAVGTSLLIIAINTISGFLGSLSEQDLPWQQLMVLTSIATVFAFVSSRFAHRVPQEKLKLAFGWFILLVGSWILIEQMIIRSS
jgi:uncharacterized membrane protein YfcA